jgi:putative membrane protein
MKLRENYFLWYKLLNSSFTGLSVGILFTIYQPLTDPSIYSLGGIVLAAAMLIIAKFYDKLLNIRKFFQISMGVEIVMLMTLLLFMALQYTFTSALLVYMGYQFTFIFGGYLVRAETLVAKDKELLGKIDINKQLGYLLGLGASFLFFKSLEYGFELTDAKTQISILHYFLVGLQAIIILVLANSFIWK